MPFSPRTHKATSHLLWSPEGIVTTNSSVIYDLPLMPLIDIYDNTGQLLYYSFDAHNPDAQTDAMNPPNNEQHVCTNISVTIGKNKNTIEFTVLDELNTWNRALVSEGNIVRVTAGKTTSSRLFLFKGRIKKMRPKHIGNGFRQYTFEGIGEKAETNYIKVTYQRAATSVSFDDDINIPTKPDSQMQVHVLVKELLESLGVQITTPNQSIKDYLGLDLSGISTSVAVRILSVNFIDVPLSTVLDFFAEISGAYWDIRDSKFIFEFPKLKHSGIVIKADTSGKHSDLADEVAYFVGDDGWEYTESIDLADGFMTHVPVKTIIATKSVANFSENQNQLFVSTLYKRHLAQQFTALDSRFITLKLVLSQIGDPTGGVLDPEHPIILTGDIVTDNNDTPTGSVIASFEIPYQGLTSSPTDIFINDLKIDPSVASPNTKYWVRIHAIGVSRGDSVRWHHNNDVSTTGIRSAYAVGDVDDSELNWKVSERGPAYLMTMFAKIQRIQIFGDQDAADRYNRTDSTLDVTYLEDVESVSTLAQLELAVRSNPARVYDAKQVTVPKEKLYYPGEMVTIVDPILSLDLNENVEAEIQEVDYNFNSDKLGLQHVSLKPLGEYHYKLEDLSDTT